MFYRDACTVSYFPFLQFLNNALYGLLQVGCILLYEYTSIQYVLLCVLPFNQVTGIKSFDFSMLYTTIPHQKLKNRLTSIIRNAFIFKNVNLSKIQKN